MTYEIENLPWERTPEESNQAFRAFCSYRDLGPTRTTLAAYRLQKGNPQAKKPSGCWCGWSVKYKWPERAKLYDDHMNLRMRQSNEEQYLKDLEDYRVRQVQYGKAMYAASLPNMNIVAQLGTRVQKAVKLWADQFDKLAPDDFDGMKAHLEKCPVSLAQAATLLRNAAVGIETAIEAEGQALAVIELLNMLKETQKNA